MAERIKSRKQQVDERLIEVLSKNNDKNKPEAEEKIDKV